jgi:peptidylprolyl isomerase/peptidyl-prolyl cis-trans isomerase D
MMKQMRENTKIILWVVVVAFVITIFAVWGLDLQSGDVSRQPNLLGRINGVTVTPQMYQAIYSQLAQQFRAQSGELSAAQHEMIREQTWDNIVSNVITSEQIEKLGITVSDEEIVDFLRTSPPAEVQQYFVDQNGNFDYAKYQEALNNPEADWTAVEELARQRIPVLKLNQYLMAQVHVSASDLRRSFAEQNTKLVVEYVEFPIDAEDLGGWTPSDEDVKAYYDAHADEFRDVEKAVLEFVRVPIAPSAADRADILSFVAKIREDAVKSGDFAAEVRTFSEAHTAAVGGETGLLGRGQRDEAVMNAADALKPGEISGPILTADGVYVVQLIEKKKEKGETKYNLRELFVKLGAGSQTVDSLSAIAQSVQENAKATGDLAAAAKANGLEPGTSEPFAEGMPIPGLGYAPAASRFAFASEPGAVSEIISDERNYFVCRLKERIPAAVRPVDQVADGIRQTLMRERRVDLAMRRAEAFERSVTNPNVSFAGVAAQYQLKVAKTDSFTVAAPPPGMPAYSPFGRAALRAEVGSVAAPVESGQSVYVLKVGGRRDPGQAEFNAGIGALRDELQRQRIQEYVMYWYTDLREKAEIEDLRGAF